MVEMVVSSTTLFGQWLRQRRRSFDLTQTELARRVGCSVVTIRKIEIGERRPSREMAALLADILGVMVDEQAKFIQFARGDANADSFRHPLFHAPELPASTDLAPEEMFPADFPGWINVTHSVPPQRLATRLLVMRVQSGFTDSPRSECLADGRLLCKIFTRGRTSGHLEGVITQEITHLVDDPEHPGSLNHLASLFELQTADGNLKGSFVGFSTDLRNDRNDQVRMNGQILSATPAYADLLLAQAFYEGNIYYSGALPERATFERGVLTIVPR
jgi:transcriptional regulator with XRE-family HTH domain